MTRSLWLNIFMLLFFCGWAIEQGDTVGDICMMLAVSLTIIFGSIALVFTFFDKDGEDKLTIEMMKLKNEQIEIQKIMIENYKEYINLYRELLEKKEEK